MSSGLLSFLPVSMQLSAPSLLPVGLPSSLPLLVDAVIGLTALEGAGLLLWHRLTGRGVPPRDFLLNLLSGLCLMFALRFAVGEAVQPVAIALALFAAGAAHLVDLMRRASHRASAGRQAPPPLSSSSSPRRLPRSVSP